MPPSGDANPIKTPGACPYYLRHSLLQFATCTGRSSLAGSAIKAFWLSTQLLSHFRDDSVHVQGLAAGATTGLLLSQVLAAGATTGISRF